jgi:hypothetical protein
METTAGLVRFDSLNWQRSRLRQPKDQDSREEKDESGRLYCATCGRLITRQDQQVPVGGAQIHTFRNPHGLVFKIGCFATAPGCDQVGEATEEWTWFPGYSWQVAVCMGCGSHLGWRYLSRAGDGFYGLILRQLRVGHGQ